MGVLEIDRHDAADAFGVDVGGGELFAEGEGGEDGELGTRVETVDVGGGIGFGVAELLRFGEHGVEGGVALFNFCEDEVAGAVQDAVELDDAVSGDAFAQDGMDGDAAGDARLHGEIDTVLIGERPQLCAAEGHQFFVGGDDGLALTEGFFDDVGGSSGSADGLDDDVDFRMADDVAPGIGDEKVRRAGEGGKQRRELLLFDGAAADGCDVKGEAEFLTNGVRITGQDFESSETDVAEPDDSDGDAGLRQAAVYWSAHLKWLMIATVWAAAAGPFYFRWERRRWRPRKSSSRSSRGFRR